jgi:hypothetical protein
MSSFIPASEAGRAEPQAAPFTGRYLTTPGGRSLELGVADTLNGGAVLPGFALPLREWFAWAEREAPRGD